MIAILRDKRSSFPLFISDNREGIDRLAKTVYVNESRQVSARCQPS